MIERLRVARLRARRGRRIVVDGLDWCFERGRVRWVVGDNGDGKSTLLRVLAGRGRPAGGEVVAEAADGRVRSRPSVVHYRPEMRLPPDVRLGAWRRLCRALTPAGGEAGPGIAPAVEDARRAGRLSTGQAKRLLLDALLALPSELTVLDEPYDHLAAGSRRRLTRHLRCRAEHSVVIVATNHRIPVPTRGGDVLVLADGAAAPREGP